MGKHDDISPERLRSDLRRFAQFVQRMDEQGRLLEATPRIMRLMGDLRAKLFAYEVRATGRLAPSEPESPEESESRRIVEEALRRARKAQEEWGAGWDEDEE